MARPRLGDSESKRLQMVITENELEAIDDWQHANKVSSRSEAIRRLVQMGLRLDEDAENIVQALREVQNAVKITWTKLSEAHKKVDDATAFRDDVVDIHKNYMRTMVNEMAEANNLFFALLNEIEAFKGSRSMAEAMKSAQEEREIMQREIGRMRLERKQRSEK